MDSQHIGSNELLYIRTEKVNVTIKGKATHPNFEGIEYKYGDSTLKIHCSDEFELTLRDGEVPHLSVANGGIHTGEYAIMPMFYEQQQYEIVIEGNDDHKIVFWHDNINVRNKVTRASRNHEILSGVINFGNEIGYSDLIVQVDGSNYLRLIIEVFPTKIDYKEDYQHIVEDVTKEVYNLVFDFLKKTYWGYQQGDKVNSSPVEFFAVINKIYGDFLHAADTIMSRPHHLLETTHEVMPGYKIKKTDNQTIRWIEKHSDQAKRIDGRIKVERALGVKRQVTYNTKENQITKHILQSTARKLESFKKNYMRLERKEDQTVIDKIDSMIKGLHRRCNATFLAQVDAKESSSGMSLVFSMAPGYRDLYKYYLMLLRGLSITGDVFNISIKDLAQLYEYWCFIKLNGMMKERYQLISQDIVKVQGNGLFVSLVKGKTSSCVKYLNPENGERISLYYNPSNTDVPTVTQRPDNVLSLEKKTVNREGKTVHYEYVFDAKYRVNPALEGTYYYKNISHKPGPEVDDINTMHRYRDAIVYKNGVEPYERRMFGAYVLFPYGNEEEYRAHKFFKSIDKVNIGGLPFLPSATSMVQDMLDALISESTDSAFERATLPRGIEDKLAKTDWRRRDVLVGALRNREQLDVCLKHNFYHVPAGKINESLPIHYVAIYQSIKLFGKEAGIRYYGEVVRSIPVRRREITEIPKNSDERYYRLEIKEWKKMNVPVAAKEVKDFPFYTNVFLLQHCAEVPDLLIKTAEEYRLYTELKRLSRDATINEENNVNGFRYNDKTIVLENGKILIIDSGRVVDQTSVELFIRKPGETFDILKKKIK